MGVLETVLLLWTVYTLIRIFGLGMAGQQLLEYAAQNPVLSFLYKYNYLQLLVDTLAAKAGFLRI